MTKEKINNSINPKHNTSAIVMLIGLALVLLGVLAFYFLGGEYMHQKPVYLYAIILVAALILIIGIVFVVRAAKGKIPKREPDYRTLFIIGISWIPLGIALDNPGFWAAGLIMLAVGLKNKDKWKDAPKWNNMPAGQRKLKLVLVVGLGLVLMLGFVAWFLSAR